MKIINPNGVQSVKLTLDSVRGRTVYIENRSLVTTIDISAGRGGEVDTYPLRPSTATSISFIEFELYDGDKIELVPQGALTIDYIVIIKDNPLYELIQELNERIKDLGNPHQRRSR